jgi:DNA repair protein RadC
MAYNKHDRKAYKYFVYNPQFQKIISGWEYKVDAFSHKQELNFTGLKIYTRTYLERIGIKPSSNKNWGTDLGVVKYKPQQEVVLSGDFRKDIQIPEIKVRFNKGKTFGKIQDSRDVQNFLKKVYGRQVGVQEQFVMLLMDNSLNILGYYKHTIGTPVSTLADIPMLMGVVVKSMARSFFVSHNHPSGNKRPSDGDRQLTTQLKKAAKTLNVQFLDHIIVTPKNGYFSFADEGQLSGLPSLGKPSKSKNTSLENRVRQEVLLQLQKVQRNKELTPNIYKLIQQKNGYAWMENRIINMMINDGITASSCIPQIESEL